MSFTIRTSHCLRQGNLGNRRRNPRICSVNAKNKKNDLKKQLNILKSRKSARPQPPTSVKCISIKRTTELLNRRVIRENSNIPVAIKRTEQKSQSRKRSGLKLIPLSGKWASCRDKRLSCSVPTVSISSECKRKAEMKLRKIQSKKKIPNDEEEEEEDSNSDLEDEDEDSSIEESPRSSSDIETDSDEEDTLDHHSKKSYPLRRKSPHLFVERRHTPPARTESPSDSSSESLLDIPPPTTHQKWTSSPPPILPKEKEKDNKPSSASAATSPGKSPTKRVEHKAHSLKSSEPVRALRSSFSSSEGVVIIHAKDLLQQKQRASQSNQNAKKTALPSITPTKRLRRSPERDKSRQSSQPSTSTNSSKPSTTINDKPPTLEKSSYSLRHLEHKSTSPTKKKTLEESTPTKTPTVAPVTNNVVVVDTILPPKKKPGRPRKIPLDSSLIQAATPPVQSADVPPAKRTRRTTSNELLASRQQHAPVIPPPQTKTKTSPDSEPKKRFRRKFQDPANQQRRDAIALRARQSKIMAKSRVLQSNKYSFNASWRKPLTGPTATKSTESSSPVLPVINEDDDADQSSSSGDDESNDTPPPALPTLKSQQDITGFSSKRQPTKHSPVAKCDICNLTFTRKFSLTKHLATRQHQKMLRKCGIKETRKLKKNNEEKQRNKVKRQKRREIVAPTSTAKDPLVLERFFDDENGFDGAVDNEEGDEEDEEVIEEVKSIPPWLSGRADGPNNYVCDVCGDIFIKKFDFSAHLWSHREGSDLVCVDCGLKFAESDKYNEHIDQAHIIDVKFCCQICPSKFNREDYLAKHMKSHSRDTDERFICSFALCEKKFSAYENLARHFDIKHLQLGRPKVEILDNDTNNDKYSTFPASFLNVKRRLAALQSEYAEGNFDNINNDSGDDDEDDNEYDDEEEEEEEEEEEDIDEDEEDEENEPEDDGAIVPQDDDEWTEMTAQKKRKSRQKQIQKSENDDEISLNNSIQNYLQRNWINDNSIIGCGVNQSRSSHLRTPFNYTPLSCKDCGLSFDSRKLLVEHVNQTERYMCQVCKKKFKWRYLLNRHMTRHARGKQQAKTKLLAKKKFSKLKQSFLKHRQMQLQTTKPKLAPIKPITPTPTLPTTMPTSTVGIQVTKESLPPPPLHVPATTISSSNKPIVVAATVAHQKVTSVAKVKSIFSVPAPAPPHLVPILPAPRPTVSKAALPSVTPLSTVVKVSTATLLPKPPRMSSSNSLASPPTSTKSTKSDPLGSSVPGSVCDLEEPSTSSSTTSATSTIVRKTTFEPKAGQVHTWFHQSESLYSCPNCEAKCERKSDFELHYKCHELDQPFFLCYVCFKPFRWKKDMIRHVRKKHPDEATYRCLYCNERFRINDELNDHISESHAKHRSFPCDYCGKRYAQKRYLLLHIRTQHGIESGLAMEVNPEHLLMEVEMDTEPEPDESSSIELDLNIPSFSIVHHHI
ncbi:uncharacterized protein LOC110849105 isoform X2 [Folsomia candida]|uniref:uncharacterized protein LOC110849105 isoform X2 n=1 Tax=Folsomia candida TaxID=158441 RepID=UPI000B8FAE77|nr:uncharacterized protein LOC110849105 isoform X2 [Folsomia candida]